MTEQTAHPRCRLVILLIVLVGLFGLGYYYDVSDRLDVEAIRALVVDAGIWGWLLYFAIFAGGEFLHIPGLVFVAAGILAYGKILGFALAYVGSIISVSASFVVVRRIGGLPLRQAKNVRLQKILARLEKQPIRTVVILRLLFTMAPLLNYALALTAVRFRDYIIGSTLGLILPIALATYLFDWLITYL